MHEDINFVVDETNLDNGVFYDTMKDNKCATYYSFKTTAFANANIFPEEESTDMTDIINTGRIDGPEYYLLPSFSGLESVDDVINGKATISYNASGNVMLPIRLGCKLYDTSGKVVDSYMQTEQDKDCNKAFSCGFENIIANYNYSFRPYIRIGGYGMVCTPEKSFTTDVDIVTVGVSEITETSAVIAGTAYGRLSVSTGDAGVLYSVSETPSSQNGEYVSSGLTTDGDFKVTPSNLSEDTKYYYCAYLFVNGKYYYGDIKNFTTNVKEIVAEAVDLGLSVKWASYNIGASKPEERGDYYAWGETDVFGNASYKYGSRGDYVDIGSNISGTKYDVAHVKWGGNWRMPTKAECQELIDKCTYEWTAYEGVNVAKITGPNGNVIYLPKSNGYMPGDGSSTIEIADGRSQGMYWSATPDGGFCFGRYSESLWFDEGAYKRWTYDYARGYGRLVRVVTD